MESNQDKIMELISSAAENDGVDKLNTLLEFYSQREEREAEKAYYAAMASSQAEIGNVVKNRTNNHTRSSYADMAAINAAITPIYTNYGLSVSGGKRQCDDTGSIIVFVKVQHKDGHSQMFESDFPIDGAGLKGGSNKTAIQAVGSTMEYARRYLIQAIFNVATDDNDGNDSSKEDTIQARKKQRESGEVPECPAAKFSANIGEWTKLIRTGKKTAQEVTDVLESNYKLTEKQKARILGIKIGLPAKQIKTMKESMKHPLEKGQPPEM